MKRPCHRSCNRSLLKNDNLGGPLDSLLPFEMVLNYFYKYETEYHVAMEDGGVDTTVIDSWYGSTRWAEWQTSVFDL